MHEDDTEAQLARRFAYHVLLHLPAAALKERQDVWMEHAVGLPPLMQSCLEVAAVQAPRVLLHFSALPAHLFQCALAVTTDCLVL